MDGLRTVKVSNFADALVLDWLGNRHRVSIELTCYEEEQNPDLSEGSTDKLPGYTAPMLVSVVIYGTDFDENSRNNIVVRLKFDDEKPITVSQEGLPSRYSPVFFLAEPAGFLAADIGESVRVIVNRFLNASTLKVELQPFKSSTQVVSFDLAGLAPFLPELREMCNW